MTNVAPSWRWPLALALALLGCPAGDGGDGGSSNNGGQPANNGDQQTNNNGTSDLPCASVDLLSQCPPGSNPTVESSQTAACDADATGEVTTGEGVVTGVCTREGECLILCNFEDPCRCGIDRVTDEGVFCTPCQGAAACGDALCEGGEDPTSCPIDCAGRCQKDQERCDGDDRQVCAATGLWQDVLCRDDQSCQFGQRGAEIGTVCQIRVSQGGGSWPGLGAPAVDVTGDSRQIQFVQANLPCEGLAFVEDGARVLANCGNTATVIDPTGQTPDLTSHIPVARGAVTSTVRLATPGRWPQLAEFYDDTSRTVEAIVHDKATATPGAIALTHAGDVLAGAFDIGYSEATARPGVGLWDGETGAIEHLLRFVDDEVVADHAPATALAFSHDGEVLAEGRSNGVVILWNVEESLTIRLFQTAIASPTTIAFSAGGPARMVVGGNGGLEVWDLEPLGDGNPALLWTSDRTVEEAALSPDGVLAVRVLSDDVNPRPSTLLLDATTGELIRQFDRTGRLDFDPHGGRLLIGETIYADTL